MKKKRGQLILKLKEMYWLLAYHSELSIDNNLLLRKEILKPVWSYGIHFWGCTKKSTSIKAIQTFSNKVVCRIAKAPWYIHNQDVHRDLKVSMVEDEVPEETGNS